MLDILPVCLKYEHMFWKFQTIIIVAIIYLLAFNPVLATKIQANPLQHLKQNISISVNFNLNTKNDIKKVQITSNVFKETWKNSVKRKKSNISRKNKNVISHTFTLKKENNTKFFKNNFTFKINFKKENNVQTLKTLKLINSRILFFGISNNKNFNFIDLNDDFTSTLTYGNFKNIINHFIDFLSNSNPNILKNLFSKDPSIHTHNSNKTKIGLTLLNENCMFYIKKTNVQEIKLIKIVILNTNRLSLVNSNTLYKFNKRIEFKYTI